MASKPFGAKSAEYARRAMEAAARTVVSIGIQSREGTTPKEAIDSLGNKVDEDATLAEIAAVHEFGTEQFGGNIPERSYLRSTADEKKKRWVGGFKAAIRSYASGDEREFRERLSDLGSIAVGDVRAKIRRRIPPPLAESTKAARQEGTGRRQSSDPEPLIDTGQLINSISAQAQTFGRTVRLTEPDT